MGAFFPYLFKVILCSAILMGYYYIALRNKLFHQWNRFYLLSTVFLSIIIPFFSFTISHTPGKTERQLIEVLQVVSISDEYDDSIPVPESSFINKYKIAILYSIISFGLLIGLLLSLRKVFILIQQHAVKKVGSIRLIITESNGAPFSFFGYLFWHPSIDMASETGQQIFKHEIAHIKERHTIDKLSLQLVLLFYWSNPVFWLIRRELSMVHEFIADQKAIQHQDVSALSAMILQAAYPKHFNQIITPFFNQSITRRLFMLTKTQNPKVSYMSRLFLIPLMAVLVFVFAFQDKRKEVKSVNFRSVNSIKKDTLPSIVLQSGDKLTLAQLKSIAFATLIQPDTDHTMVSATFSIGIDNDIYYVALEGDKEPDRVRTLIDKAKPGNMIFIESRKVVTKEGKEVKLPAIFYYIK